ncbi:hypothetical protein LINPERHAP2_LOCUS35023 [Linum perenne]
MCVEIDLHKPLVSKYRLHRRVRRIEYEGLHEICFTCGRYGHGKQACSLNADTVKPEPSASSFANPLFQEEKDRPELDEDFGPWMLARKNVRRRNPPNQKSAASSPKDRIPESGRDGSRFNALEDILRLKRLCPHVLIRCMLVNPMQIVPCNKWMGLRRTRLRANLLLIRWSLWTCQVEALWNPRRI